MIKTNPSYSVVLRIKIPIRVGMLGKIMSVIGRAGGDVGAVDIVGFDDFTVYRDPLIDQILHRHRLGHQLAIRRANRLHRLFIEEENIDVVNNHRRDA